jgi:hypothetical protein
MQIVLIARVNKMKIPILINFPIFRILINFDLNEENSNPNSKYNPNCPLLYYKMDHLKYILVLGGSTFMGKTLLDELK